MMVRVNVRLGVFLLILSIAVQFGDCQNENVTCEDGNITPGSDKTTLSWLEKVLMTLMKPVQGAENIIGNIIDRISRRKNTQPNEKSSFSAILQRFEPEVHAILPGTLWCGDGDIAKNTDDLGLFKKTDACCRAHDNCKNDILAGETELNLKNNGIFTRSACTCDNAFYNCLKNASNIIAYKIGKTYFNILQPQCFECVCPTDDCAPDDDSACKGHCLKYKWVNSTKY